MWLVIYLGSLSAVTLMTSVLCYPKITPETAAAPVMALGNMMIVALMSLSFTAVSAF